VPVTAADLVVEAGELDTVGGGKALNHLLAHVAPTEIGEDAERHERLDRRAHARSVACPAIP